MPNSAPKTAIFVPKKNVPGGYLYFEGRNAAGSFGEKQVCY